MRCLPLLVLFLTGCPSVLHFQRADTLGRGGFELGGDASGLLITDGDERIPMPWVRGTVRWGLTHDVDLGFTLGLDGVRTEGKFLLHRGPATAASLSVGLRANMAVEDVPTLGTDVTFRYGIDADETTQLVFSVRGNQDVTFTEDGANPLLFAGGGLGLSIRPLTHLRVMPELGVLVPYYWNGSGFGSNDDSIPFLVQAGVGVVYTR